MVVHSTFVVYEDKSFGIFLGNGVDAVGVLGPETFYDAEGGEVGEDFGGNADGEDSAVCQQGICSFDKDREGEAGGVAGSGSAQIMTLGALVKIGWVADDAVVWLEVFLLFEKVLEGGMYQGDTVSER